ncbi:guanine deaminase [Agaribacter flavus]|uniref:Guanine deaminase n=1 Tax=Agaribacter flavus TaxID=1902781 RepID=A0ABV7FJS7_9ALTE
MIFRGSIAHFPKVSTSPKDDIVYLHDGAIVVENGKITAIDDYKQIQQTFPSMPLTDYSGKLIVPGFIDSHTHFPQTEMIASYGEQLLAWLAEYTFPTELKFADKSYSEKMAGHFIQQLVRNGTTTALAFSTVHAHACNALFSAAAKRNMAMITGKVCMDRHCPEDLQDTPELAYQESKALIEKWHGKGRSLYAITPRFAPTSSDEQLQALGKLASEYPDVFIQTHLSENKDEIAWVSSLFPHCSNYLGVYQHYGLVRKRAVFGHCIHLQDEEWQALSSAGATVAFCPSSNLFLGSGLFDKQTADKYQVQQALASDVGAGTSFNLLRTYGEAYKVSQLKGQAIDPLQGLYMMTMGAAAALELDKDIGNLNPNTFADFVVLEPHFNSLSTLRINDTSDCADTLFALSIMGDERCINQTYIAGIAQLGTNKTVEEPVNAVA